MTSSVVEYENILLDSFSDSNKIVRSTRPRWERKRIQNNNNAFDKLGDYRQESSSLDRYIPSRAAMDVEKRDHFFMHKNGECPDACDSSISSNGTDYANEEYKSVLSATMLGVEDASSQRILSFKHKAPKPKGDMVNHLKVLYSSSGKTNVQKNSSKLLQRHIASTPTRILDAPDFLDDYYLNLLSWSSTNYLAIALSQQVYIWNAASGDVQELCTFENGPASHISSVSWIQGSSPHLAIGTSAGTTQLWDVSAGKQLRSMDGHSERVGSLSWNLYILSSGGKDGFIVNHDVRVANHRVSAFSGHVQEVCGLKWSPDGAVLASGSNDNRLCIWDRSTTSTSSLRFCFTDHQAAVKALAWSPHERNVLASGGGTADRSIKFWKIQTGSLLNSVDTGSQVCSLVWNPNEKEILSSHGFEKNQLSLWKYPSMIKVKELEGHTARVLQMECGPDNETVVSAAADETLRFWNVFSAESSCKSKRGKQGSPKGKFARAMQLR